VWERETALVRTGAPRTAMEKHVKASGTTPQSAKAPLTFGPHLRIRHKRDFERLQRQGRKLYSTHFLLVVDKAETPHSRIALAVTKKVEPRAAFRNTLRRRLKEIFRLHHSKLTGDFDILIIARKDAQYCEFAQVQREVLGALHHAGLLRQ